MTEQPFERPLPRRVYFGAEDRKHLAGKPGNGAGDLHAIEIGRRQKLAQTVTQRAEDVVGGVRALRAFDGTGNTEDALNHLQAALQDLNKAHAILVDDVTESIGRYRDRRENRQVIADVAATRGIRDTGPDIYLSADAVLPDGIVRIQAAERDIAHSAAIVAELDAVAAMPKPGPR